MADSMICLKATTSGNQNPMRKPIQTNTSWACVAGATGALLASGSVLAQSGGPPRPQFLNGHYPAGVEGIKAASLPPPGFFTRDYNYLYTSDSLVTPGGASVPVDLTAYVNAFRNIWITEKKVFGANYGMDVLLPFVYTDFKAGGFKDSGFEFGDICVEPLLLSWNGDHFDFSVAYAFWAPTGAADPNSPSKPGKDFWSNMFTAGATWYPALDKSWALSVLNRYEVHTKNDLVGITPGNTYTLEWGLSKSLCPTLDFGVIGYYQQQVNNDHGPGVAVLGYDPSVHAQVWAAGPELSIAFPKSMCFVSARFAHEFSAVNRTQGETFNITLTKRW